MRAEISRLLPASVKRFIAELSIYEIYTARRYAKTNKRLDICSSQIAFMLQSAGIESMEGKTCLEVGSGWVLSHALVYHLLGAKRIITTDIAPHAHPKLLKASINASIESISRDLLAQFSSHHVIRQRLERLKSIPTFSFDVLRELGLEYISPIDLTTERIDSDVDFIFSNSVLEHVPVEDAGPLLQNLNGMLNPGGQMIHAIHMEDHRNFAQPFDFLSIPIADYQKTQQTSRGNRIRLSTWESLFNDLDGSVNKNIYEFYRRDKALPDRIDSSVAYTSEDDLRCSHLSVLTTKLTG